MAANPISYSTDRGNNWSKVQDSNLPNPGSGSDIVSLPNGHWAIAYNDTEDGRHSLAVSISTDEGKSWAFTRHLELDQRQKPNTAAYPALIVGTGNTIHIVYSYVASAEQETTAETIKYAKLTEAWVLAGDNKD